MIRVNGKGCGRKCYAIANTFLFHEYFQSSYSSRYDVSMERTRTFEDLACWQEARSFKVLVLQSFKEWPHSYSFEIRGHLLKTLNSITSNIAEGYGKHTFKDKIKFIIISRGSLHEAFDQVIMTKDLEYICPETLDSIRAAYNEALYSLNGFIKYLRSKN